MHLRSLALRGSSGALPSSSLRFAVSNGLGLALAAGRIGAGLAILMSTIVNGLPFFWPTGDRHCVAQICGESCAVHVRTAVQASIVGLFLLCASGIHRIAEPPLAMMEDMHEPVIQLEMEHVPSAGDRHRTMFTGIVGRRLRPLAHHYGKVMSEASGCCSESRPTIDQPNRRLSRGLSPR